MFVFYKIDYTFETFQLNLYFITCIYIRTQKEKKLQNRRKNCNWKNCNLLVEIIIIRSDLFGFGI